MRDPNAVIERLSNERDGADLRIGLPELATSFPTGYRGDERRSLARPSRLFSRKANCSGQLFQGRLEH